MHYIDFISSTASSCSALAAINFNTFSASTTRTAEFRYQNGYAGGRINSWRSPS
jgi:hypothetical protein